MFFANPRPAGEANVGHVDKKKEDYESKDHAQERN